MLFYLRLFFGWRACSVKLQLDWFYCFFSGIGGTNVAFNKINVAVCGSFYFLV